MAYRIFFTKEAKKDIDRLDKPVQKRLQKKLKEIADCDNVKPLVRKLVNSNAGEYRLRTGDYRVIFDLERKNIYILRVRHRREVYR